MNPEELLRLKIRLLTEGATLPTGESGGRKGGAGPIGGRYFLLPNGNPVGIPIRSGKQAEMYDSAPLLPTNNPKVWLYDTSIELEQISQPDFYSQTTKDGIPFYKIALLHGKDTLATTVYQHCRYWDLGLQCKFCTIPYSLTNDATILEKTPSQIQEVLIAAEAEGVVRSILLTTGTPDSIDVGIERLYNIVKAIREVSDLPIGIQIEPPLDESWLKRIHEIGVDTIGIHIETADSDIRAEMCPGKYQYADLDRYRKVWKIAVDLFGRGNVSTFILHGLGEELDSTLELVNELAEIGVLSVVTPIRPAKDSQLGDYNPQYIGRLEESVQFYKNIGHILFNHKINPNETRAGCHSCGGCTPIQEAYDWAASA